MIGYRNQPVATAEAIASTAGCNTRRHPDIADDGYVCERATARRRSHHRERAEQCRPRTSSDRQGVVRR